MTLEYRTESDIVKKLESIKGKAFSDYRKKWTRANNFELETDFPLFLHIEAEFRCNMRCSMCVHGIPELKKSFTIKKD